MTEGEGVGVGKVGRVVGVEKKIIAVEVEVQSQVGKAGQIHLLASLMREARMLT